MIRVTRFAASFALVIGLVSAGVARAASCPPLGMADLAKATKKGPATLVFFASWCASCEAHLREKHPPNTIFIAAFDTRARAEAVAAAIPGVSPCHTDDGVAAALGVKSLPATRAWPSP